MNLTWFLIFLLTWIPYSYSVTQSLNLKTYTQEKWKEYLKNADDSVFQIRVILNREQVKNDSESNKFICTGSKISKNFILTAAHCVGKKEAFDQMTWKKEGNYFHFPEKSLQNFQYKIELQQEFNHYIYENLSNKENLILKDIEQVKAVKDIYISEKYTKCLGEKGHCASFDMALIELASSNLLDEEKMMAEKLKIFDQIEEVFLFKSHYLFESAPEIKIVFSKIKVSQEFYFLGYGITEVRNKSNQEKRLCDPVDKECPYKEIQDILSSQFNFSQFKIGHIFQNQASMKSDHSDEKKRLQGGDSGGPLLRLKNDEVNLIGVASSSSATMKEYASYFSIFNRDFSSAKSLSWFKEVLTLKKIPFKMD